jgi:hypothetical protein
MLDSIRKHAVLAAAAAAMIALSPFVPGASAADAAASPAAAQALTVTASYVTNTAQQTKTSFNSGDPIYYHIDAKNSSSTTISVSLNFFASTIIQSGGHLHEYIIIDKTYSVNMAPGLSRFYTPSTVPQGVTSGQYKLEGSIYENANRSDNSTVTSSPFSATRVVGYPLKVPYFSQFSDSPANNECGETSVAMAAAYYADLHDGAKAWITAARNNIGVSSSAETNAQQLTNALWDFDQITVTPISYSTPVAQAVKQIQAATKAGYPVIAFVNAARLQPSRPYTGHWIVIVGISGNTVYINDPDNLKRPQGTGMSDTTTLPLSVYETAAQSGAVGEHQPYGLIVTGEHFSN